MIPERPYRDIIEDKIRDWKENIELLKQHAEKTPINSQPHFNWKITQLRSAIETATLQLHDLDSRENFTNTVMIKDEILRIFDSIDRDLTIFDEKTPFML